MAKRWYYKDENGNKVPVPQYKIDADDYYTKAMSDSRYYDKSATDTLLGDKVSKSDIVQSTGTSTTAVMSQKASTDSFIATQDGSCYFDTLEEIKSVPLTFDLKTNPESVRGYYRYSFYIVPKSVKSEVSDPNQNVDTIKEKSLTHIDDISSKLISDGDVDIVPDIEVEDGYKDKVIIKWKAKDNVNYKLVRYTLDNSGSIDNSITAVSVDSDKLTGGTYTDNEIESGKAYSYTVYASNDQIYDVPSNTVKAYTLGTPVVSFDTSEIDYDSITVKWNTVMHNAEYLEKGSLSHGIKYTVVLKN